VYQPRLLGEVLGQAGQGGGIGDERRREDRREDAERPCQDLFATDRQTFFRFSGKAVRVSEQPMKICVLGTLWLCNKAVGTSSSGSDKRVQAFELIRLVSFLPDESACLLRLLIILRL
jgi:hypothetical protein